MTVIASGEIDLKLSARALSGIENDLAKVSNQAGRKLDKELSQAGHSAGQSAGSNFSQGFGGKVGGIKDSIGKAFSSISPQQILGGVAAAGTAIAAFAASSINHFTETAQSVRGLQRVTGQTAEESSKFVAAFDDMGISAGAASSALFKLSKNVSTGGEAITNLGIGIAKTKDNTVDLKGTFLNVAEAVAATADPTKRAEIAFAAFGKQGAALLPILEKGRAGIEKLFAGSDLSFTQKQLDDAEDYRLAMDRLGDSVGKVQNTIGAALVPKVVAGANALAGLIDKADSGTKSIGGLGGIFDAVSSAVLPGVGLLTSFGDEAEETALDADTLAAASTALGVSTEQLTGKTKDQVLALLDEKKAFEDLYTSQLAAFDANFAYQESLNASEDATAAVTEKQNALNVAIRDHTAASPEAAAATEALERALLAQAEQTLRTADAAGRMAEQEAVLRNATDTTTPRLDAQIAALERQKSQVDARNVPTIQKMIDKLNAIKSEYGTRVDVDTANAERKLDAFIRKLNSGAITPRQFEVPGMRIPGRSAAGGPGRDQWAWTGEMGPEPVFLPRGSQVVSRSDALRALREGGVGNSSTSTTTNNITVIDNTGDPDATASRVASRLGERSQR